MNCRGLPFPRCGCPLNLCLTKCIFNINEKIIISIIIVLLLIVVGIIGLKSVEGTSQIAENVYSMFSSDVDAGTSYLFETEEFDNMNQSSKIEEMGILLNLYQKNGLIDNLYYDDSSEMYTFTYGKGNIEGALGGVWLKEWDPMMN